MHVVCVTHHANKPEGLVSSFFLSHQACPLMTEIKPCRYTEPEGLCLLQMSSASADGGHIVYNQVKIPPQWARPWHCVGVNRNSLLQRLDSQVEDTELRRGSRATTAPCPDRQQASNCTDQQAVGLSPGTELSQTGPQGDTCGEDALVDISQPEHVKGQS